MPACDASRLVLRATAARVLGRALGPDALELPILLGMEFRHRRARTIAEEYLETHGYPSLRSCCTKRTKALRASTAAKLIAPRPGAQLRKPRTRPIADPSRN